MEELIKKAIEGGYEATHYEKWSSGDMVLYIGEHTLLDPLFWQALSKSCVWKEKTNGMPWWRWYALMFYEKNLNEGMDKGIEYLKSIVVK